MTSDTPGLHDDTRLLIGAVLFGGMAGCLCCGAVASLTGSPLVGLAELLACDLLCVVSGCVTRWRVGVLVGLLGGLVSGVSIAFRVMG